MFTANRVQAAPVLVSKAHLAQAEPQAVVINSGIANAATGEQGELDALATAAETAALLGLDPEQVLVLSTGVIGVKLPMPKLLAGLGEIELSAEGGAEAAEAILTTDTYAKEAVVSRGGFTVGGMAKGAGMIHPCLATMLAVVTTDYPLQPGEAHGFLKRAVDESFNRISVDGECSTNDAVILLANGASGIERTPATDRDFAAALSEVCADLSRQIVMDGEGATVAARDRGHRRCEPGRGRRGRQADRHLAARQDRRLRPRPELGPRSSPPPARRSSPAALPRSTSSG